MESKQHQQEAALREKSIAEKKFQNSDIKSALKHAKKAQTLYPNTEGIYAMVTTFNILYEATKTLDNNQKNWYKILQVEPFSHINSVKSQYKKLALILHPDKNQNRVLGSEEAFKLVSEGFRVLNDKIRKKEFDLKLRIGLQNQSVVTDDDDDDRDRDDVFWTACYRCRVLHKFERKYLGHNLVCPSCKKSFVAVEVGDEGGEDCGVRVRSERFRRKEGSAGVVLEESVEDMGGDEDEELKENEGGLREWGGGRVRSGGLRRKVSSVDEVLGKMEAKKVIFGGEEEDEEENMTLADMRMKAVRKGKKEKLKQKEKESVGEVEKVEEKQKETYLDLNKNRDLGEEEDRVSKKRASVEKVGEKRKEKEKYLDLNKNRDLGEEEDRVSKKRESVVSEIRAPKKDRDRNKKAEDGDIGIITLEDSDFYEFDKDRLEKSFKKGQVWAIYDDDDGMPRHYCVIDEVVSVNPFEVKLSWLDLQSNGDERLTQWENTKTHASCGKFKVSRKTIVDSLNIFSHVIECERAARELYRIYPRKGSVWALYNKEADGSANRKRRCYGIVILLTTYSDVYGLSIAHLEKVDRFKTVFKRREVGYNAITWLGKDDVSLFSHQIPARKLTGDEAPDLVKDCWELDPASVPWNLLSIEKNYL